MISSVRQWFYVNAACALVVYLFGAMGIWLTLTPHHVIYVWPAGGVALALLLVKGRRHWPGVFFGTLPLYHQLLEKLMETASPPGYHMWLIAGLCAFVEVLRSMLGYELIRRRVRLPTVLEEPGDILWILLLGGVLAGFVSAGLNTLIFWKAGIVLSEEVPLTAYLRWTGELRSVILFSPMILLLISEHVSLYRRAVVPLASLMLFLLSVYAVWTVFHFEAERYEQLFKEQSQEIALSVKSDIESQVQMVEAVAGFFAASSEVTRKEFDIFTHPFLAKETVEALGWDLFVPHAARTSFEAAFQAQGIRNFSIREKDDQGALVPALKRARYLPITLVSPHDANASALGFDLYTDPKRQRVLDAARDQGKMRIVAPVSLINNAQQGLLLYMPVYQGPSASLKERRTNLLGFAAGVFIIPEIFERLAHVAAQNHFHAVIALQDVREGQQEIIYTTPSNPHQHTLPKRDLLHYANAAEIAGSVLHINLAAATAFTALQTHWVIWMVVGGGVLLTGMLSVFILGSTGRADTVKRLVDAKTQALAESERQLQMVIDNTADGLIAICQRGLIQMFNPACEKIFGYRAEEVLGKNLSMLMPEPHRSQHDAYLDAYHARGTSNLIGRNREFVAMRKDGSLFPIEVAITQIASKIGAAYTASVRDVTARREAETAREQMIEKLTMLNEQLEQFAYVASHDLREPIRMVRTFTDLLAREYDDKLDQNGRDYIAITRQWSTKMESMLTDLLEFARLGKESEPFTEIDCNRQFILATEMLGDRIRAMGAVVTADVLPLVYTSPVRLLRLMQNLIGNALKYHAPDRAPVIHCSIEEAEDHWTFAIRDNGIGIRQEYMEKIFMPFTRLHSQQEIPGAGMGLAICRKIVETLGGTLWVESAFGQGSTFYFTLPKRQG